MFLPSRASLGGKNKAVNTTPLKSCWPFIFQALVRQQQYLHLQGFGRSGYRGLRGATACSKNIKHFVNRFATVAQCAHASCQGQAPADPSM